jgi:hypothetical protein
MVMTYSTRLDLLAQHGRDSLVLGLDLANILIPGRTSATLVETD